MSVKVMAAVWESFPQGGSELLAILALADWSDDEGRCWPSMGAIGHKTRLSRSQAQRVMHLLIEGGFVRVTGNVNGGAPGQSRQYQINLDNLVSARTSVVKQVEKPETVTATKADASKSTESRKAKINLKRFLEECKSSGVMPIPDSDPIFLYIDKVGISEEMLGAYWHEFKQDYEPKIDKTQKDWRAFFRNHVRKNYYKLWFLKDGEDARWTTAGEQARRSAS